MDLYDHAGTSFEAVMNAKIPCAGMRVQEQHAELRAKKTARVLHTKHSVLQHGAADGNTCDRSKFSTTQS
jgi:hypothetical protein